MKKLVLVLVSAVLLGACSGKEQPQEEQTNEVVVQGRSQITEIPCVADIQNQCTINGQNCCKLLNLLQRTDIIFPSMEEIDKQLRDLPAKERFLKRREKKKELTQYKNPELEKMGFQVIDYKPALGPYASYQFSNGLEINIRFNPEARNYQIIAVTITKPDGTQKKFGID